MKEFSDPLRNEPKPRLFQPKTKAAGIPGVWAALQHAGKYMRLGDAWKLSFAINQKGGFDCPGCAWPDPDDDRSALGEYCENGIKAIAEEATKKTIGADFFAKNSLEALAALSDFELGKMGRLTEPMVLREGATHYTPITWEEANALIARELNALESPDAAAFYTSGRTGNEAAFLYQLFVRAFGTNNLPDCSNMCHESSGVGLMQTVGIGKGSVTLEDFYEAEVVVVMGQNPGTNHPRMLSALENCKLNGGKIITVNPLPEAGLLGFINPQSPGKLLAGGTELSDLFLPIRINGDVAFLKAVMLILLDRESENPGTVLDAEFIAEKTTGFEELKADLAHYALPELIQQTGLTLDQIEAAANLLVQHNKIIICWAMGLTQHENGVDNVREIVNLLLMKGAIGKPGAGTCPVRGHSNVQGDRTMGIWEAAPEAFLARLDAHYQITVPRKHGYAVVDAIKAMHSGAVRVFFALGGNFLSATPDTHYTAEALRRCRLTAHVSTKLNRSHLVHGATALILPCLGRTDRDIQASGEQFVTVENSMGVVHSSKGILKPVSAQLRSEVAIVAGMAQAVLGNKFPQIPWMAYTDNYDRIRASIEACIPGFERFNERVRQPGGFYLPNGARSRDFTMLDGRARFSVNRIGDASRAPGEYRMMTIRSHDQYNTTVYGLDDRYRGIEGGRRVILMNEKDMAREGIAALSPLNLHSTYKGKTRSVYGFLAVPYPIPEGCTATYFPEANPLVPIELVARESHTPASKLVRIRIEKSENSF